MPEDKISLSVIIPVYNAARDLCECLTALINSSCPGVEIMVVDDGSTDDTHVVAREMGVQVLRLEKNSGPAAARNHGARYANGEILFFVDADVVVVINRLRQAGWQTISHMATNIEMIPNAPTVIPLGLATLRLNQGASLSYTDEGTTRLVVDSTLVVCPP